MPSIIFKRVRFKNFLSFGQYMTEIVLNDKKMSLVVGGNGQGKSCMLDAITFALFGKPFRDINKPQLVNSINERDCLVEIEFSTNGREYLVRRGIKPSIFEIFCNGKLLSQTAENRDYQAELEKTILGMTYKAFTQIVILGSSTFIPFMRLKPPDRRTVIETILDIGIFSTMNVLVKQRMNALKADESENESAIRLAKKAVEMQESHIAAIKRDNEEKIHGLEAQVNSTREQLATLQNTRALLTEENDTLLKTLKKLEPNENKLRERGRVRQALVARIERLDKEIEFYTSNCDCPTCKQAIDLKFKNEMLKEKNETKAEVEQGIVDLDAEVKTITEKVSELKKLRTKVSALAGKLSDNSVSTQVSTKLLERLEADIKELTKTRKRGSTEAEKELKRLRAEQEALEKKKGHFAHQRQLLVCAGELLQDDGIKAKIIRQYLPPINKYINQYLTAMDAYYNFNLNERFEESIKSRHRDEFSYSSFSEGEKQRIDLALLLTWRNIGRTKNSVSTNLLILDEVFDASLDPAGTDAFLKLLMSLPADTNCLVISHKGDSLEDKFQRTLRFEKVSDFSRLVQDDD